MRRDVCVDMFVDTRAGMCIGWRAAWYGAAWCNDAAQCGAARCGAARRGAVQGGTRRGEAGCALRDAIAYDGGVGRVRLAALPLDLLDDDVRKLA